MLLHYLVKLENSEEPIAQPPVRYIHIAVPHSPIRYIVLSVPPQMAFSVGISTCTGKIILGLTRPTTPNGISVVSAVIPQYNIQTDRPTDRVALVMCHKLDSNSFRVIANYLSKVADFNLPHLHLAPALGVTQLESRRDLWNQKTRVPGLSCGVVQPF